MLVSSHVLAEVAQTVDDVVVIHRGRLVEQGPVSRLTAGGRVRRVARRAPDELRAALERDGLERRRVDGDAARGRRRRPARVGEIAFAAGVPLHELTTRADLARGGVPRAHRATTEAAAVIRARRTAR